MWALVCALLAWVPVAAAQPEPGSPAPSAGDAATQEGSEAEATLWTLHAPVGGRPLALGELGVACSRNVSPWSVVQGGRALLPPRDARDVGTPVEVEVASSSQLCEHGAHRVRLVATGEWPRVDPASLVLSLDEKRADASGETLAGAVLAWHSGDASGSDICFEPSQVDGGEHCAWSLGSGLSADPSRTTLRVRPRGSEVGPGAIFFDARGRPLPEGAFEYRPARVVLQRVFPADASVDLSTAEGRLAIRHAEGVAGAQCDALTCELRDGHVHVRGGARPVETVEIILRLKPGVKAWDGESLRGEVRGRATVVHCPMSVVSGEPFRDNGAATVAVRLGGPCSRDVPLLDFQLGSGPSLEVLDTHVEQDDALVMLALGHVSQPDVLITATRRSNRVVVAAARSETRALPPMRAAVEVRGFPNVDFIPTNRWAEVHVAPPGEDLYVVALPIPGVYQVRYGVQSSEIRGDPHAAGLTGLRLGIRSRRLPAALAHHDLAAVTDPLLRNVHRANVPEPIRRPGNEDLVAVRCGGGDDEQYPLRLGETVNLPFGVRDTCRVIFRRDLLRAENGVQRLRLRIEVFAVDGSLRAGAVDETVTLAPGDEPRVVYVDGVRRPFDRLVVRVAHSADDTHYLGARELGTEAPDAKWSGIFGTERARLYATTAFPTGLYRLSSPEHSGVLSLNFGLLSRLTWLDAEGHEGLLSLETGLVVVGIGNAVTDAGESLTQVGAVIGLGFNVPFANSSSLAAAALNVHAWLEVDVTRDNASNTDGRFAFIFGPSISIGNLGTNL